MLQSVDWKCLHLSFLKKKKSLFPFFDVSSVKIYPFALISRNCHEKSVDPSSAAEFSEVIMSFDRRNKNSFPEKYQKMYL